MDHTGHTDYQYDTEVHDEVVRAEAMFNAMLSQRASGLGPQAAPVALKVETNKRGVKEGTRITEFDPTASEIMITAPMVGG